MKKIVQMSHSLADTRQIAAQLAACLKPGDVVAFFATMGMGKTTFSRYLLESLGFEGEITSPTFSLVNEYKTPAFPVYHFDFYRLHDEEDLFSTGYYDFLNEDSVLLIEWAEKIPCALPKTLIAVNITPLSKEGERRFIITRREDP